MLNQTLAGRTVAVFETRELEVFANLLQKRGAQVLRCPLVTILDSPDVEAVLCWLKRFASGGCDDLILLTGEGLRRLLSCIEQHEPSLRNAFVQALRRVRKVVRGPKPARVLRELGMHADLDASAPTTDGIIATLAPHDLAGRRIGVQLYGSDPNEKLTGFLAGKGALVLPVAPYIYADKSAQQAVQDLLVRMQSGQVDVIVFTSKSQVERLLGVIPSDSLRHTFARTRIAAIGPVVRKLLQERGLRADFMPDEAYFMKPLVRYLEEQLGPA